MSIQAFSFPVPETRFFQAGQHIYKFKIRQGENSSSCEEGLLDGAAVSDQLEMAVRAVLANLDDLQPFTTQHFNIFPYKSKWERVSKLRFMKDGVKMSAYPFLITLYVEWHEPAGRPPVTNTSLRNLPKTEAMHNSSQCVGEPVTTVHTTAGMEPHEGAMSQDNQFQLSTQRFQCLQESPCVADAAEVMLCDSEIHADSEVDAAPETPDPNSAAEQNTWTVTKLASSVFPFSLFFHKTSAK